MGVSMWGTVIPMTILAYWLCFRVPQGFWWSVGITLAVAVVSPAWGFAVGYANETAMSNGTNTAFSFIPVVQGMAMGAWMIILAPAAVWLGRKRRREDDALAWKYK